MKIIADKFDIDIFEVVDAASTKPLGFNAFYPGPVLEDTVFQLTRSIYLGRPRNMDTMLNL